MAFKIVKFEVELNYGGPEEGGWHFTSGVPVEFTSPEFVIQENAYAFCRQMNRSERLRQEREEHYSFSSVLSYRSTHFEYDILPADQEPEPFPAHRPHYE